MAVFQPAEEIAIGAQSMIDDGLFERFPKPDVVLGQHVMVGSSGVLSTRTGAVTSAGDSLQIRIFGRGAHGSMPEASIDPVMIAAATVLRLQTIVSRELGANEPAVVTIGVLQAGTKENVIPDEALIKLNVRTFDGGVRKRVLAAIKRIVESEAAASGAPRKPGITPLDRYSLVSLFSCYERSRGDQANQRCISEPFSRGTGAGGQADNGERGLRMLRSAMGRASRILVCGRHRSRGICESAEEWQNH